MVLVGRSDLDFIVEHSCGKHRLSFRQAATGEKGRQDGEFVLLSEKLTVPPETEIGTASLRLLFDLRTVQK